MKKRTAKRIVTFLLAIVMTAAMPISINAAESPAEPLSVNARTATFSETSDMYFGEYGGDTVYGEYTTIVVFNSASNTSNEVYSATVYPDFTWNKKFPTEATGKYVVRVTFDAVYQRLNHYSYGHVTQSYDTDFYYYNEDSGHFRIPSRTFYIKEPTDDSLGFNYWLYYEIRIDIYLPSWDGSKPDDYVSDAVMSVRYNDVVNHF